MAVEVERRIKNFARKKRKSVAVCWVLQESKELSSRRTKFRGDLASILCPLAIREPELSLVMCLPEPELGDLLRT